MERQRIPAQEYFPITQRALSNIPASKNQIKTTCDLTIINDQLHVRRVFYKKKKIDFLYASTIIISFLLMYSCSKNQQTDRMENNY